MTGIILAGGRNSRISMTKALIKIGQVSIIENTVKIFKKLFDEIIVVTNEPENYRDLGVKLTKDIIPGKGPLGGLYTGLKRSTNYYNFVVACDMPFIDSSIILNLQQHTIDDYFDIIVPEYNGFIEPLFSIYSQNCVQAIKNNIKMNQLKIRYFFTKVKVKEVKCEKFHSVEKAFFNINTREDLQLARKYSLVSL